MMQPKGYFSPEYLEMAAGLLKQIKQRSYALMHVTPGDKVLDAGCGSGIDTVLLGQVVGPGGHVFGIDSDPAMIDEAQQRARQAGVDAWVQHQVGNMEALPLESDSLDASRCERVLQHLKDPARAVAELVRVTRSGGWVVVMDTDWGTTSIDSPEIDIERRLARVRAEVFLENGYVGRQLYRLFKQHRLLDVQVEILPIALTNYAFGREMAFLDRVEVAALAAGIVTEEELERWRDSLERYAADEVLFGSTSLLIVAGRKA
jgi:ubiquinone/menaquinone biosynthesis C-methylase UbiE